MKYYLDTNIFLYANTRKSKFYKFCRFALEQVAIGKISAQTSVETIQEIIFVASRKKQVEVGIRIAKEAWTILGSFCDLTEEITGEFLKLAARYPKIESRDLVHAATCKVLGIDKIISIDKHFDKISEVEKIDPREFEKEHVTGI